VLITGCSSGFGRPAIVAFMHAGWNVVATMRNTTDWKGVTPSDHLLVVLLALLTTSDALIAL